MNIPFTPAELIGVCVVLVGGVAGYAKLGLDVKNLKEAKVTLEADVEELKTKAITVALLEHAVSNLEKVGNALAEEARESRATMEHVVRSLVRIETRLDMEPRRDTHDYRV